MKRCINLIKLEQEQRILNQDELNKYKNFMQNAILLSLLNKEILTKNQYERCIDELNRNS